ncbi:MAG: type II methionyl aminopeptidase, partial [Candidatus Diapherotrites archaeon]|nr:type II methionyl aminopeptidase [Candidatus Diapherotrites archaeon]
EEYQTLPFAERWIEKELKLSDFQRKIGMRELMKAKCIRAYPVLREETGKTVTQAEKSFIIFEGKTTVIC